MNRSASFRHSSDLPPPPARVPLRGARQRAWTWFALLLTVLLTLTASRGFAQTTELFWDDGTTDAGTMRYTHSGTAAGEFRFRVIVPEFSFGMRVALKVTSGNADLYVGKGFEPAETVHSKKSTRPGSDGVVFGTGEVTFDDNWFILVKAEAGAQWSLVAGNIYVHDLGQLPYNDANANHAYDPGEVALPGGSGPVAIGPEGMRIFKVDLPPFIPAWSLWLNGGANTMYLHRAQVALENDYEFSQDGRALVVRPFLTDSGEPVYVTVAGNPGESINLDSRILVPADLPFGNTRTETAGSGVPPFKIYRVNVPPEQLGWDVSVTPAAGANTALAVRKGVVPGEFESDAFSNAPGNTIDSVALVPPGLTDGEWFITVWSAAPAGFTLSNGSPPVSPIAFTDTKANDQPQRAGWRYYALTDIPSQLGKLGWQLELTGGRPNTEIAVRRNALPGRWSGRSQGQVTTSSHVDGSSTTGRLDRPGHQADVWYAGVYQPEEALGAYTLNTREIPAPAVTFNSGSQAISIPRGTEWRWFRVEVPENAELKGWELRCANVTSGSPALVVRRGLLPADILTSGFPANIGTSGPEWPQGAAWTQREDYTHRENDFNGLQAVYRRLTMPADGPLQAGTYFVGITGYNDPAPVQCTLESRGIGAGFTIPVALLGDAATPSSVTTGSMAAREVKYYRATVPAGLRSWEVTLTPSAGDMTLTVRKGTLPAPDGNGSVDDSGGKLLQKPGRERYVLLPRSGEEFLAAGDYYLAAASEGVSPGTNHPENVGTGSAAGTLQNAGPLPLTDIGTATAAGLTVPVTLEAGQTKFYRVLAPAGIGSLEARLDNRTGNPSVSLIAGERLPAPTSFTGYGFDFGAPAPFALAHLATIPNAAPGEYRLAMHAASFGDFAPATATLVVTARPPAAVTFNGGSTAVTGQIAGSWRFFRVEVPAGVEGWEVRLGNITGGTPTMAIRRDALPEFIGTTQNWGYSYGTSWLSGDQAGQLEDFTWRSLEPDTSDASWRTFVAAMGRPLEPGVYYAGVYAAGDSPATYTFESRGIGGGQAITAGSLAFSGGTAVTPVLPARRAAYYKVTVPANTPSWELTLDNAGTGEMSLWVRHGTLPDPGSGNVYAGAGAQAQKLGSERFLVVPPAGEAFLTPGDHYIAVVSEGTLSENLNLAGTGTSSGTLTSLGSLAVTNLGTATAEGTQAAVDLASGQTKAWQITVAPGTVSLDVRLDTATGFPLLAAAPGAALPGGRAGYGTSAGQPSVATENELHVATPEPGVWTFLVTTGPSALPETYPPATGTLHISTGTAPAALNFDGGISEITGQAAGTWQFWRVDVPAGAGIAGWDLRLVNVTSGSPRMVVRRSALPVSLNSSGLPANRASWPSGASRTAYFDLTKRWKDIGNVDTTGRFMVSAMGNPLEPGTYFVGVTSAVQTVDAMSYKLESRGIGTGQTIPVTNLTLNGEHYTDELPAREARYYKATIPAGTKSWELQLQPYVNEFCLLVQAGSLPDSEAHSSVYYPGGRFQSKKGNERFVLLPPSGEEFIPAGDYYVATVSEGRDAGFPDSAQIGTGIGTANLISRTPLPVTDLGEVSLAGRFESVTMEAGQYMAFRMNVPAGATALEIRMLPLAGAPLVAARAGGQPLMDPYYSAEGGAGGAAEHTSMLTIFNPAPGPWTLRTGTEGAGLSTPEIQPATGILYVRLIEPQRLNFSAAENGNGFEHTHSTSLLAGQHQLYSFPVPPQLGGQEIPGWLISAPAASGQVSIRVFESADFTADPAVFNLNGNSVVMAPPYFRPGRTWYVDVQAATAATYTLNSQPAALQGAPWTMPAAANQIFADTGTGLNGDKGIDLANDTWHFYAFDVPAGNGGLLRAELQALNGNPDLYLRSTGGIPTPHHDANGPVWLGDPLVSRSATGTGTEYANWTPLDGRTERQLTPGRWHAAVHAAGPSNARYRLLLSTGSVQTVALNGGSVTGQNLAPGDVRYYQFTLPLDAPKEWKLTLSEQQGNVQAFIRDTVPPGRQAAIDNTLSNLIDWGTDQKNGFGWPVLDASGTYTLTTPPLRPGNTYYVGVVALDTAQFSLSSATAGGSTGTLPVLDLYTGEIHTTLTAGAQMLWRVPAPADAARWKHSALHSDAVRVIVEQGSLPPADPGNAHYASGGADSSFNREFPNWPWVAGQDYYLLLVNTSATPQEITLTMEGSNTGTEDDDGDGLPNAWEEQYSENGEGFDPLLDDDKDGLPNAIEYVLGLSPVANSAASAPAAVITGTGNARRLTLEIPLPADIPPQAHLEVFAADTPGGAGTSIAVRPPGGTWTGGVTAIPGGGVAVQDTQPYDSTARRFLWLTVTLVP